jgi:hypothetical protein
VGAELFHADEGTDRQTDRQRHETKLIVTFCNIANAANKLAYGGQRAKEVERIVLESKLHNGLKRLRRRRRRRRRKKRHCWFISKCTN